MKEAECLQPFERSIENQLNEVTPSDTQVHHPQHYTQGYCETIYEIRDILGPVGFKAYCLGNWIKYNARAAFKNGDEDLKKAEVYLEWATNGLPKFVSGGSICDASTMLVGRM